MTSTAIDVTLLSFNSIDLRTAAVGDVVVFRSGSITHNHDLAPRHGTYARITGFGKGRTGMQQVSLKFKDDAAFNMAPSNLVARTKQVDDAAKGAHDLVQQIVSHCTEAKRPWMVTPKLRVVLGDLGMYDRLGEPAQATGTDELPY